MQSRPAPKRGWTFECLMWLFLRLSGLALYLLEIASISAALYMGARTQMDMATLMRWAFFPNSSHIASSEVDPTMGWVSPDTFIPMAESLGLIHQLGGQVWQAALEALAAWRERGYDLLLSVNISKRQLFHEGFTRRLLNDLDRYGISPDRVILEVTESLALLDVENGVERLPELKRAGFRLAIDYFGTGYSSLSQLHEMPVDELKIDISFVRRLDDPRGLSMVQAIISLAHTLGLRTIAEGVEDETRADKLRALGVDTLQGYHFAKPMPKDEFEVWLEAHWR